MKRTHILLIALLLLSGSSYGWSSKSSVDPIKNKKKAIEEAASRLEIYEERPNKPYTIIAPIRSNSGTGWLTYKSQDEVFKYLKRKAAKLGADAIINLDCGATTQFGVSNGNGGSVSAGYCQGMAVKWK